MYVLMHNWKLSADVTKPYAVQSSDWIIDSEDVTWTVLGCSSSESGLFKMEKLNESIRVVVER